MKIVPDTYKYVLTLDRLTLSLKLNEDKAFDYQYINSFKYYGNSYSLNHKIELRKCSKRLEKYYLHSFEVWIEGRKIGALHTDSRLPQTENLVKFEFDNHIFYVGKGFNYYLNILTEIGLYVESISYLEIALDAQFAKPLLPRISNIERNSTLDEHNPNPKFRPLRKNTTLDNKGNNGASYTFGNAKTGKKITCYDKLKELIENSQHKTYISSYFLAAGFDLAKKVERVEARIFNKWLAANNIKLSRFDLADAQMLFTLFIKALGDTLKFVPISAAKTRNKVGNYTYDASVVDLLPLSHLHASQIKLPARLPADKGISDNRKRTTHKTLIHQFISTGSGKTAAAIIHFEDTTPAPENSSWSDLRKRYALDFEGKPTAENKERIEHLSQHLECSLRPL